MKNYLNQNLKMNLYMETCERFSDTEKFAGFNWFRLHDITLFLRLAFHVSECLNQVLYYFKRRISARLCGTLAYDVAEDMLRKPFLF